MNNRLFFQLVFVITIISCNQKPEPGSALHIKQVTENVNDDVLANVNSQQGDWLTYGLNYQEDRCSPIEQINEENIKTLGLAWSVNLESKRGIGTTPLVADGIMFLTGAWSMMYAVDVGKGSIIWKYDAQVPRSYGEKACCDVVNRGAALYKGKVFIGTLDGRLIALDASDGKPVWSVTTVDTTKSYTITGAPRIVEGKVIIGNGGAENGGGLVPNLAYSTEKTHQDFLSIVHNNNYLSLGMPRFSGRLSENDVLDVQKYILTTANEINNKMKK